MELNHRTFRRLVDIWVLGTRHSHIAQLSEVKYSMLRIKLGYLSLTRALNKSRQMSQGCLSGVVFGSTVKGNHKPSSIADTGGVSAGTKRDGTASTTQSRGKNHPPNKKPSFKYVIKNFHFLFSKATVL